MKKLFIFVISLIMFISIDVFAMDTLFSINKYTEEDINFIEKSYDNEGNSDGFVVAGKYLNKKHEKGEVDFFDYQVMIVKYNKSGKIKWKLDYGKTCEDVIYDLDYSYDDDGNINGYLLLMNQTYDVENKNKLDIPLLINIDLEGNLVGETIPFSDGREYVFNKLESIYSNGKFENYVLSGYKIDNNNKVGLIAKLDNNFSIIWSSEYKESGYLNSNIYDIVCINKDNECDGYASLVTLEDEEYNRITKLIQFDKSGNYVRIVKEDFEEVDGPKLALSNNGFIIYGLTDEVKLKNNKFTSYYLVNYDSNFNSVWETVGDSFSKDTKYLVLYPVKSKMVNNYLLMYKNSSDSSIEIVKINNEGILEEKVKKINNEYYDINNFISRKDVLYFVGNIKCPEYDNCGYVTNSLFLISTEDKVIEVKADDNENILLVSGIIVILLVLLIVLRKINDNKKDNK